MTFVTPTSTFEGNRLLNIKVLGGNFNPASVVVFNGEELQTVFVNAAELQAVIPTRLLTEETDAEIRVVTPPPGGGTSTAAVFVVNPKPSDPLLAGRINVGSFPAGVAVDSVLGLALVTNESGDSVSVVDISREIVTDTIGVGRSPAEGIAVDSERGIALVANVGSNDVSVIDLETEDVRTTIGVGRFPLGVAVDSERRIGLVVNGEDGNVSVVDLDSLTVTGTIGVGDRPAGVAIDLERGEAVVANRGNNTVSVIDLDTPAVTGTIGVGGFPRGVAIDSGEGLAFVTNANSNTVSMIDLERGVVVETIEVGSAPTGVAVYEATGHEVVTNSGVTSGTRLGALSTASIIDVVDEEVVANVPVGSAPFGVDVDQREQLAVVANFGSNDVTLIRIPNPTPRIEGVSPETFPTDGSTFTITITGTGFLPTSVVTLNGQTLPTTYISATELEAEVSGELMEELLQVSSTVTSIAEARLGQVSLPTFTIGVTNPGPGGGDSADDNDVADIAPDYQRPTLRSITPDSTASDEPEEVVTLNGGNFTAGSIVNFGDSEHSPFDSSANQLRVLIPGTDLEPGVYAVSVTNPGAGTSRELGFEVTEEGEPGSGDHGVGARVGGSGIGGVRADARRARVHPGHTGDVGGTGLNARITPETVEVDVAAGQVAEPGTLSGLVTNEGPGGGSAAFSLSVTTVPAAITSFAPTVVSAGTDVELRIFGSGFTALSVVLVADTRVATEFVGAGELIGRIPAVVL